MHFQLLHSRKPFRRTDNNNNNRNNTNNVYPIVEFPSLKRKDERTYENTNEKKTKQKKKPKSLSLFIVALQDRSPTEMIAEPLNCKIGDITILKKITEHYRFAMNRLQYKLYL